MMNNKLKEYVEIINNYLDGAIPECNFGEDVVHNAMKYSISTFTLYLIKDASKKYFAKSFVCFEYLPSIGDMASNAVIF